MVGGIKTIYQRDKQEEKHLYNSTGCNK